MITTKTTRLIAIGAAVLSVLAGAVVATAANAAVQANGSDAAVYIGDSLSDTQVAANATLNYGDDYFGFPDTSNLNTPYVCPVDATGSVVFVAPKGQERTKAAWLGTETSLFSSGTKNTPKFDVSLYAKTGPNYASVKATGGDYSVGLACTISNGVGFASSGVWFASIHITAGTGAFTVDQPTAAVVTPPPTTPTGTASIPLKATTLGATDGVLSLTAPSNTAVLIGNPVIDPTTHLSTSTGTLGNVTVSDGRVVTHKGWDLTTSVTDFALETDVTKTIPKTQLGFAPALVSIPSGATGITKAGVQTAGSATYGAPFASADNSPVVGDGNTVVNAVLTFIAPATAAAGTYDSTLTLTLTSK